MSKHILFNEQNQLSARYDSEINSVIPEAAVEVSDELFWQTINEQNGIWTLQEDGTITKEAFPAPSVEELKASKLSEINAACDAAISQISATYPSNEVLSWSKQETEARAYVADDTSIVPLITSIATARNVTVAELAGKIIEKADLFAQISGGYIGKRQGLEDLLTLATTPEEIAAITW